MISTSDIILALVQYQHEFIFVLLLFCSETSDKNKYLISNQFLKMKMRFSNFQNNEYEVKSKRNVSFHVPLGANDVIKVEVM